MAGSSHNPIAELLRCQRCCFQTTAGGCSRLRMLSTSAGVEGSEDAGAHSKLPQPSQEEEALMCLLQHCICVSGPCEILGDVNAEELKSCFSPRSTGVLSMEMGVCSLFLSPEIHHQLLGLVDVE